MKSEYNTILYTQNDGVTTITLNRSESYNAFTAEMRSELLQALQTASADTACRVIVLTGAGKAFCSGQDLKDIAGVKVDFNDFLKNGYNPIILAMRNMPKPIVGRINGVAAGAGCSLALACDYCVADERASLVEVFVGIGLVLDSGSSYFLPKLVGSNKAFELATMGTKVSASQAVSWGMINKAVPHAELEQTAYDWAQEIMTKSPTAIKMLKFGFNLIDDGLVGQQVYAGEATRLAYMTDEAQEGRDAFLEKRKAIFPGK